MNEHRPKTTIIMNDTFCFASPPPTTASMKSKVTAFENNWDCMKQNSYNDNTHLLKLIQNQGLTMSAMSAMSRLSLEFIKLMPAGPVIVQTAIPPPVQERKVEKLTKMSLNIKPPDPLMMANPGLCEYLENIHNDAEDEHLNAPIYFSCDNTNKQTKTEKEVKPSYSSRIGFGLNALRNIFTSVIKLPTAILSSLTETPPQTPHQNPPPNRFCFDLEDVDFMPDPEYYSDAEMGSLKCDLEAVQACIDSEEEYKQKQSSLLPNKNDQVPEENDVVEEISAEIISPKTEIKITADPMGDRAHLRKRTNHKILVTRSPPLEVKHSNGKRPFRPSPNFYHEKRTLNKNRKEKQKNEIYANIQLDFGISTDSEDTDFEDTTSSSLGFDENYLLPVTARNLIEPSCLGQLIASNPPSRRRSSSFHCSDKDFPLMFSSKFNRRPKKEASPNMISKRNSVYFEIPNSPKRAPVKSSRFRTASLLSTASSSPGSSFETGKFWDCRSSQKERCFRERTRTISDCSDDLIEFVNEETEDGVDNSRCFWDYTSDEEEDDDDDESSDDDEGRFDSDEEKSSSSVTLEAPLDSNLPDSGVEEKKVSPMFDYYL